MEIRDPPDGDIIINKNPLKKDDEFRSFYILMPHAGYGKLIKKGEREIQKNFNK